MKTHVDVSSMFTCAHEKTSDSLVPKAPAPAESFPDKSARGLVTQGGRWKALGASSPFLRGRRQHERRPKPKLKLCLAAVTRDLVEGNTEPAALFRCAHLNGELR